MFDTVNIFTININLSRTKNIMLIVFTQDETSYEELKEYYLKKYKHIQQDQSKFSFINKGKYNTTSNYFDLACEALNYSCTYS